MKEKKKIIYIILTIIILILLFINIKVFISHYISVNGSKEKNKQNKIYNVTTLEEDEKNRKEQLASLDGKKRMQTYFGTYISYVESKNYDKAYNLLYDGFKQTYFPSLQEFENYAKQKYPNNIVVNYIDIQREGTIYILKVEIKDALSSKQTQVESTQVVITESNINDYKISFEVK